ncbi:MAG: leucine-rich repeat domain-containing protein, partial [Desulfobacterales bacterium]
AGLTNLGFLELSYNQISDISPLAGLTNLGAFGLAVNQISDISPLVNNLGIGSGDLVRLNSNPLSTTSCNAYIPELIGRGAWGYHDCP